MNSKPVVPSEPRPAAVIAASSAKAASATVMNAKPLREQQPVMAVSLPAKPAAPSQNPRPLSADSGTVIQLPQSRSLEQSGTLIVDAQRP